MKPNAYFRTLVLVTLFLGASFAWADVPVKYTTLTDIPYRTNATGYAQGRCKVDVYYPENQKDCPVTVWFHGGGL